MRTGVFFIVPNPTQKSAVSGVRVGGDFQPLVVDAGARIAPLRRLLQVPALVRPADLRREGATAEGRREAGRAGVKGARPWLRH